MEIYSVSIDDRKGHELFSSQYFSTLELVSDYIYKEGEYWYEINQGVKASKEDILKYLKWNFIEQNDGMCYVYRVFENILSGLIGENKENTEWRYVIKAIDVVE